MLKVYRDIGEITTGIKGLQDGQETLNTTVGKLHDTVGTLVTKEDCESHREACDERLDEIAACAGQAKEVATKKGALAILGDNAGNIVKIMGFLGAVGTLLWGAHEFLNRLEIGLARNAGEQKKATKMVLHRLNQPPAPVEPHLVYVPVPVPRDAGIRPRPRRRPRRRAAGPRRATP
jgi:hypothetical protein